VSAGAPTRLLIVDDEEPILFALKDYFSARSYEVDCATARDEAEALIARHAYSAVIADLRLAGDGHEGLELVGFTAGRSPATHVIVLTAYGSPEVESAARGHGAEAFLHKPIPLAELERVVAGLVEPAR
jgi:DNA-binding response OmpR family regulator